jgi:hypothetical protein
MDRTTISEYNSTKISGPSPAVAIETLLAENQRLKDIIQLQRKWMSDERRKLKEIKDHLRKLRIQLEGFGDLK